MGNKSSALTRTDILDGTQAVATKLQARAADPNKCLVFSEDCGPLPRGSKVTPLGYAILSGDIALLDVLLSHGADPNTRVGIPHRFDFTPLQLAAALGQARTTQRLLATGTVDPNARLQLQNGYMSSLYSPQPTSQPTAARRPQPGVLVPSDFTYTREGDTALHMAIDCHPGVDGLEVVRALVGFTQTNLNAYSSKQRTPLFKACRGRHEAAASLLASHPRCDVNAGGPIFAAIAAESPTLVQLLVNAGADVSRSVVNDSLQTPLRCAMTRSSLFFTSRADVVQILIRAGAEVEPGMLQRAGVRRWYRVARVLERALASAAKANAGHAAHGSSSQSQAAAATAAAAAGPSRPAALVTRIAIRFRTAARPSGGAAGGSNDNVDGKAYGSGCQKSVQPSAPPLADCGGVDSLPSAPPLPGPSRAATATERQRSLVDTPRQAAASSPDTAAPTHLGSREEAAGDQRRAAGSPLPLECPAIALVAGALARKLLGRGVWPVVLVTAAVLYGRQLASRTVEHGRTRERLQLRAVPPAVGGTAAAATGGSAGVCAVCLENKATQGFVHGDVVHVCVCEGCEAELRRRRQLRGCPICRKPFSAVLRAATDITPADLRCGAGAVTAKLRIHGVDPDSILQFRDTCGPLPRGSTTTLLGYALLSGDAALLDALLSHGADPNKRVGLPHTFNFTPLQLAVALGLEAPVRRLLAAPATNPNAPLQLKTRGATRPMHKPQPTSQPTAALRPQPGVLVPSDFTYTREGDTALHMGIDCHQDTAPGLLQALLDDSRTYVNALNAQNRSPLYKACRRRSHAAAASLLQLPRCDVNAGGPVFGAIAAESPALVQVLVNAGADVSSSVVNERGQTPLRCALERESVLFVDRAQVVRLLTAAGAGVAPDMLAAARRRGWKEVLQALLEAPCQEAGTGALAVSGSCGSFGRVGSGRGGGGGGGSGGGSGAGGSPRTPRTPRGGLTFAASSARFVSGGGGVDSEGEAGPKPPPSRAAGARHPGGQGHRSQRS
ncbi:hypothetical protein HYH03_004608 [Edaphochlamys debaryana]|uniref:RING-type domain-containing protein n=1 Tax=Edaphochlamys debaryana TaxID=47281 RepID=A0A835Y9X7_9CHLO|nr:hypothetical protein HYH03_004608 [Edaphochlamys debaryana]|eukprot:KAG2497453.1 hypothetical protein HYH03_004608 [Edaphochlamys debaryana]